MFAPNKDSNDNSVSTLAPDSHSALIRRSREMIFIGTTIFGALIPIFAGILPHFVISQQTLGMLLASVFCVLSSVSNYLVYRKLNNLDRAGMVLAAILCVSFSIGILSSGGVHSSVMIFAPSILIFCGLLNGPQAVLFPTIGFLGVLGLAVGLEKYGIIEAPAEIESHGKMIFESTLSIICGGALTYLFVYLRQKTESTLLSLNKSLAREKEEFRKTQIKMADSEQFLKVVLQNIPSMIFAKDFNNDFSFALLNRAGEKILGVKEYQVLGKNEYSHLSPSEAEAQRQKNEAIFSKPDAPFFEVKEVNTPQGARWLKTQKVPTFDEFGRPHLLIGIATDITEQLKQDLDRAVSEEIMELIQRLDQALAISDDVDALIKNALSAITINSEWAIAAFWRVTNKNDVLTLAEPHCETPARYPRFLEQIKKQKLKTGVGLAGHVWSTGQPMWIPDISSDPHSTIRESATLDGIHGAVAFPITAGDVVLGIIELYGEQIVKPFPALNPAFLQVGERIGHFMEKKSSAAILEQERTRAAQAAHRFETMFQSSPMPTLVVGDKGILDCNRAALRILGVPSRETLLAYHPLKFSPKLQPDGDSSENKMHEMENVARAKGLHQFEWLHQKLDGTLFPAEVTLSPIEWHGQNALLVLWTDLSEKKQRDLQMIQTSKLASLGEMSAGIAHEINNPLAIISGSVNLLVKFREDTEKFNRKIELVQKSVVRISKIITGLRKFSRSGDKADAKIQRLSDVVKEALVMTEAKIKNQNVAFEVDLRSDAEILCNDIEIEQVIINIVGNAVDAIENLSDKWIKLEVFEENQSVTLRVTDSGNGIPPEIRSKLFDPFFTTKIVGKGTGLGLAITKGILDEHKATIEIVADHPHTCFEIRFPRPQAVRNAA